MTDKKFQKKLAKIEKQGQRYKQEYELQSAYAKYVPEKKKRKVSNIMLVVSVIAIVSYVVASFMLQFVTSVEISSTISTLWFAFWTGEIFVLAGIKCSKTKHGYGNTDESYCNDEVDAQEYDSATETDDITAG